MDSHDSDASWFGRLWDEAIVAESLGVVASGKEATVFLCRATRSAGGGLVAVKVYRERRSRSFRNDAAYKAGRVVVRHRDRRALADRTAFGRRLDHGLWVEHEAKVLATLGAAGADVPRLVAAREPVIVMSYLGDEDGPSPPLRAVHPGASDTRALLDRLLWNVRVMLGRHLVHADLSPYNVLVREMRPWIIDFPQAVDARTNANARDLLRRDVAALCAWAARHGVARDAERFAARLWRRYEAARL